MKLAFSRYLVILLLLAIYGLRLQEALKRTFSLPENSPLRIRVRITSQPYQKASYQIINAGRLVILTDPFPAYFYDQKIEIFGKFEKRLTNKFKASYVAYLPSIRVIEDKEKRPNLLVFLLKFRDRLEGLIKGLFPEPHSGLLLGMIFGIKQQIPEKFLQYLRQTGTIHVVVASGQNLTIISQFLVSLLVLVVSRKKALVLAAFAIIAYILISGAEAPVVRAGIMAGVMFLGQFVGREPEATMTLFLAAMTMLLVSPLLIFDIGFQLSLAATAGIIWFYPVLAGKRGVTRVPIIGEALATTIAAQLGVMPIILGNFWQISFLSPLINAFVLWLVPIIMAMGGGLAIIGLIAKPLAGLLSWFVWLPLEIFIKIIEFFGKIPWASLTIEKPSSAWILGYYTALSIFLAWRWRHRYGRIKDT